GKTAVPQSVEPIRALQPGAEQAAWREHARKGQQPRDDDERREQISARDYEKRTRTQDGELGEQQGRGDRIVHEHRHRISRDEGIDPWKLDGRERAGGEEKGDQQGQHNGKGKPFLRQARRQVREDEMLFLWCGSRRVCHRSAPRRGWSARNQSYFASRLFT